jgi:Mrp family chromosome partitioning ATPase
MADNEKNEENCNHECEGCSVENCEGRKGIEKLTTNSTSGFKHTIGIISGKGGVGKSFVTSMLAVYLNREGYKVGILDGDITGPSIPKTFNIHEQATGDGVSLLFPAVTKKGIKIISSNMLLANETDPIIWRGVLVSSLLKQFYTDVLWEQLDYLLIDMPPGTGDVTLTAFQSIPMDGVIIVTSPQDLVSVIVKKAVNMAKQMNIKVLGLVENMSYVECPHCKEKIEIYGKSHAEQVAKDEGITLLGRIPIKVGVSDLIDQGKVEDVNVKEFEDIVKKIK